MRFGSKAVHVGNEPDPVTGAVTPPIYATSTFAQDELGKTKGYDYSRLNNPTRERLEKAIASLEGGKYGLAYSSGMAAISAVSGLLKKDDDILVCNDLYGGTYRLFSDFLPNYGITFRISDANNETEFEKSIRKSTKMIWLETPTNPLMLVLDIERISRIAKRNGLLTVVDNTFASPYLQNPLSLGADVVIHSTTKYISGHSDLLGGVVVTSSSELHDKLHFLQYAIGAGSKRI